MGFVRYAFFNHKVNRVSELDNVDFIKDFHIVHRTENFAKFLVTFLIWKPRLKHIHEQAVLSVLITVIHGIVLQIPRKLA